MKRFVFALTGSFAGALLGCAGAAGLDAYFAVKHQAAAYLSTFLVSFGLLAPLSLLVAGLGLGARLSLLSDRAEQPWWRPLLSGLNPTEPALRRERAVLAAATPLLALAGMLCLSRFALSRLASGEAAGVTGIRLAWMTLLVFGVGWLLLEALARRLQNVKWSAPSPFACAAVASALVLVLFLYAVKSGATSGAGGPLTMLGVLNRDELDLRPVGLLLLILLAGSLWPAPRRSATAVGYAAVGLACFGFTLRAGSVGFEDRAVALAIETATPLASKLLPQLRRLSDRDRDGYSAWFGGGDCADRDARINPLADDVPANGVDEDCSGSDARLAPRKAPSSPAVAPQQKLAIPHPLSVVLLTVDTLRHDLGYAGNTRKLSPNIDQLAQESVLYERAYALASYTAKSLPPMLIGKYSSETHRGYSHFNRFEKADIFLAERLQSAGIKTVSVQGHWYFFQNFGMERGFSSIDTSAAPRALQAAEGDRSSTSEALSDAVLAQLSKLGPEPFFLWAHYTDPHAEYLQHEGFDFGANSRAAYDSEVAFVDHHVGRVLGALRKSPLWERTAVILTSDHGEAFGEHGMIRHGFELWEELVRVPLLLRVPSVPARRVSAPRSAIDVVPTILELFKLTPPSGSGDFVSGTSLMADVSAEPQARPVFVDMAEGPYNAERRAFIVDNLKLITSRGRTLGLYDLARDPAEKHDLAGDRDVLLPIQERYADFRRSLNEVKVRAPN